MAISSETRRAGPFTGNGTQQEFPFAFKVFSADQVKVLTAEKSDGKDVELDSTAYSVTLSAPLPVGSVLAILSAVPYLQPMTLTNRGGFFPTTLNDSADRAVILAQQNAEVLSRCVTVDATDTMTPSELKQKLLDAANNATVVAKGYAESAKTSADAAAKSAASASNAVTGLDAKAEELIKVLEGKGYEQSRLVEAEGDEQVRRVEAAAADAIALEGLGGAETSWVLSVNVSAGSAITIADGHKYVVGRHHLRVSWNGVVLYLEKNFNEIGTVDSLSNSFSLTFNVKTGDELDVWIAPLGRKDVADAIATAKSAEEAVSELSRKVVYKNQESAE